MTNFIEKIIQYRKSHYSHGHFLWLFPSLYENISYDIYTRIKKERFTKMPPPPIFTKLSPPPIYYRLILISFWSRNNSDMAMVFSFWYILRISTSSQGCFYALFQKQIKIDRLHSWSWLVLSKYGNI